jgi:hypothetical protein
MRTFLNPKWLLFINTVPVTVFLFLFYSQFTIIKSLLTEDSIRLWKFFCCTMLLLGLMNVIYAVIHIFKNKNVSIWYALFALISHLTFMYLYVYFTAEMIPFNIPSWMVSGDIVWYAGTFLMPTLMYALLVVVAGCTSESNTSKSWLNFLIAVSIPLAGYLFYQIIFPLWQPVETTFFRHSIIVIVIVATLVFLFFILRGIFIINVKNETIWYSQLVWKIIFGLIFPLIGLAVNNQQMMMDQHGVFGNFNHPWFYILAILNGILVCLPERDHIYYRLFLFLCRCLTFAFTLYFFIVFLPFIPLSVVAIIAVGTGFLMLTPLILFVIQTIEISKDITYLKRHYTYKYLIMMSLVAFMVIPAFITIQYVKDRHVMAETLSYLYSPDYKKSYHIDVVSLQKTLDVVKHHKRADNNFLSSSQTPFLSAYFNWLVLDNLTLSDTKINTIEKIFFGTASFELRPENINNKNVDITKISSKNSFDHTQKAWRSWVDIEITNKNPNSGFAEYATTIDLPARCWISDYYLYVGDKKEYGMLAEKKSAKWIFSQIRNQNRDPGILYYLTGNKVAFRVFPFSKDEVRKTGIEFLHKDPIDLVIDEKRIRLGDNLAANVETTETQNVIYVPADLKKTLKMVQRKPYFHFMVDVSVNKEILTSDLIKRMEEVMKKYASLTENAQISFVNSQVQTFAFDPSNWKDKYRSQTFESGYYLERAIKKALVQAYEQGSRPIIVAVTDSIKKAILENDFADLRFTFPESQSFFVINENGELKEHSLVENPRVQLPGNAPITFDQTVLEYKLSGNEVRYLSSGNTPEIILKKDHFDVSESNVKEKNWISALTMHGHWMYQMLHPETTEQRWLSMVKNSFISKVMTPVTSYLVVENEAQKAALAKKQQQVLSGKPSLDLHEDAQRMSEPEIIILVIIFGFMFLYKNFVKTYIIKSV